MEIKDFREKTTQSINPLFIVTPLSKYLALLLFILMPFIGGWIGYHYAPEKVITQEKFLVKEVSVPTSKNTNDYTFNEFLLKGTFVSGNTFLKQGDSLFYIAYVPASTELSIEKIPLVDIDTAEYVSEKYIKDSEDVYYLGSSARKIVTGENMKLGADPNTFTVFYPDPNNTKSALGIDTDSVYYENTRLEGITASEVEVIPVANYLLQIIRDTDTVWFPVGDCHYGQYRLGELSEIENYVPPC